MNASNLSVSALPGPAARPASESRRSTPGEFGRHLDAAHRRHDGDADSHAANTPATATDHPGPRARGHDDDDRQAPAHRRKDDDATGDGTAAAATVSASAQAAPAQPATPAGSAGGAAGATADATLSALAGRARPAVGTTAVARALIGSFGAARGGAIAPADGHAASLADAAAQGDAAAAPPDAGVFQGMLAGLRVASTGAAASAPLKQEDGPRKLGDIASLAAVAGASTPAAPAVPVTAHQLSIGSPVGTPAFANELSQQVTWLGQQDVKQARIRLHPEDLGPLDVSVRISHNTVDVSFAVQHPGAVHAVQQTLPQLDSLLAQHGLALGQADVGQRQQHGSGQGSAGAGTAAEAEEALAAPVAAPAVAGVGLLDTFA